MAKIILNMLEPVFIAVLDQVDDECERKDEYVKPLLSGHVLRHDEEAASHALA